MSEAPLKGPGGTAWRIPAVIKRPEQEACLASWLVNVPGAHAFWSYWQVSICHLRPIEGATEPLEKVYPEAGYEFSILTIDPEKCPNPTIESIFEHGLSHLVPPDVVEQFHGVSDPVALMIARAGVNEIVAGNISPDQDFRSVWKSFIKQTVRTYMTAPPS